MNIAQHSADNEPEVGNPGVMSWMSRHQPLPSANEPWLGTALLVERIGMFPSSGDIRRPMPDPYPLLAHLKKLYGEQALETDDRDGLKMIFSDWRFRVRICRNDPAIIINVETRCDMQSMPRKTTELLNQLDAFEKAALSCRRLRSFDFIFSDQKIATSLHSTAPTGCVSLQPALLPPTISR